MPKTEEPGFAKPELLNKVHQSALPGFGGLYLILVD